MAGSPCRHQAKRRSVRARADAVRVFALFDLGRYGTTTQHGAVDAYRGLGRRSLSSRPRSLTSTSSRSSTQTQERGRRSAASACRAVAPTSYGLPTARASSGGDPMGDMPSGRSMADPRPRSRLWPSLVGRDTSRRAGQAWSTKPARPQTQWMGRAPGRPCPAGNAVGARCGRHAHYLVSGRGLEPARPPRRQLLRRPFGLAAARAHRGHPSRRRRGKDGRTWPGERCRLGGPWRGRRVAVVRELRARRAGRASPSATGPARSAERRRQAQRRSCG